MTKEPKQSDSDSDSAGDSAGDSDSDSGGVLPYASANT